MPKWGGLRILATRYGAESDYERAVEQLRGRGQEVQELAFEGAGRAAYVTDPDGNVVELWTWDVSEHLL